MHPGDAFFSVSRKEKDAFLHRLAHADVPWKRYVRTCVANDIHTRKAIVCLRHRMIEVVKYESSLYRDENTKKMTKFRDELEGYVAIPELSHLLVDGDREEGPYILDFGSKSDASNVDLTVLDAPSVRIVDFILSRVNDVIGKRLRHVFDEAGLHSLFDVSFYLNSFIINIGGTLCYVDTEGDPLSRRRQRRHARSRLEGNTDDFSSKGEVVNRLITQKRRDLFGGIPSAVLDNTSRLAYCFPDAYRSQGGFLHVIVEIQTGVRLYLSDDQYLDSAFDNLGMLAHYAKEGLDNDSEASTLASDVFSKYVFRITHALRSIRDTSSKEIREALIRSFDAASTYDPTHLRLSCSIGNLSEKSTVKNTPARNFRSVKKTRKRRVPDLRPSSHVHRLSSPSSRVLHARIRLPCYDRPPTSIRLKT